MNVDVNIWRMTDRMHENNSPAAHSSVFSDEAMTE